MNTVRLIGYWNTDRLRDFIDPWDLVDRSWAQAERTRVADYLRQGVRTNEDLGYSMCRFSGGPPPEEMGNAELTDGTWIWPEGLAVYVARYSVRLPAEFIAHAERAPHHTQTVPVQELVVDSDFWRSWCRRHRPSSLRSYFNRVRLGGRRS